MERHHSWECRERAERPLLPLSSVQKQHPKRVRESGLAAEMRCELCRLGQGGRETCAEDRGPPHSPGACSSPSPPQASSWAHTNLARVVQNLLSRPTPAQRVKFQTGEGKTVRRRRGKALKRRPHCVKRACQSIFVSAVEMYFPRGRVPECVWPCVWRVPHRPRAPSPPTPSGQTSACGPRQAALSRRYITSGSRSLSPCGSSDILRPQKMTSFL